MPLVKQRGFKFSILCDVFLLSALALVVRTIEIVPGVFSDRDLVVRSLLPNQSESDSFRLSKRFDVYHEFTRIPYDTIHRILRDEERSYRTDDQRVHHRWRKSTTADRRISKRETQLNPNFSNNSTKSIDLVNRNLTKFVFDSDLELQLQQSDELREVTRLNLTGNRISEFATKSLDYRLPNIESLDLSCNILTKFELGTNSTVKYLNLAGNNLLNFTTESHNAKLKTLTLQHNNICILESRRIDFSAITELETLDLSCNEISQVNWKLLGQGGALKRLNLARNRLQRIDKDSFSNLMGIDTLVLSDNNISTIDPETFVLLPNLQYLDLSHNNIQAESIRSLQGIPDLVGLSIAYNPDLGDSLQEFVASWSLKELDASGTGLCQIPSALAQSVRTLKLIDNSFEVIRCGDLDSYPLLQYLDLSHSYVAEIEDDALGRLEILQTLFLDHNNLKRIPISLPTSLENLFLHNNDIMDIQPQSLQQLRNLKTLDLSRNKLTYVPGLPLPKLLVLNLQSSELRGLSQSVVKTSPKLRELLLDGNPIKCTELMGIADWATPCQNDRMPAKLMDVKRRFIEMHSYLKGFPNVYQDCPGNYGKTDFEYRIRPLCAIAHPTEKDVQSNKLESQFRKPTEKDLSTTINPKVYPNHTEDIENSIQIPPPPPLAPHTSYDDQSGNSLTVNSISGKATIIANSQSLSAVPNNIKIHDRPINSPGNGLSRKAKKNRANKANVGAAGAKSSMPIGSQSQQTSNGSISLFAKTKKNIKQKQQQQQQGHHEILLQKIRPEEVATETPTISGWQQPTMPSSLSITASKTSSNGFLNTTKLKTLTATTAHEDKLDPLVQKVAPTIPKNDSVSDKIKTAKRMMLATLQAKTTPTASSLHNLLNNKTILAALLSSLAHTTSTTSQPTTTRTPTKMMSSKVNKADKVLDQQPSAINENRIIKRNQSTSFDHRQPTEATSTRSYSEKLLRIQQSKLLAVILPGSNRYYQDEIQQKQSPPPPTIATSTLTTIIPKKLDKVKPDKHLKFIGEKNLNVTVLTYTKGHIHRTVNKDIAKHHATTTSNSAFFFDMDIATETVPPKDGHPNIQTNYFKGEHHFKVNTNRIPSHMSNDLNNLDKILLSHPQLNALHAFSSSNLNASNGSTSSSSSGLPPEHWLDIRTAAGHPGLFIVIGLTIGMVFTLGLIHIYRCRRPWRHHLHHDHNHLHSRDCDNPCHATIGSAWHGQTSSNYDCDEDDGYYIEPDQNRSRSSNRRDFLPMELLRSSTGHQNPDNHLPIW